MKDGWDSGQAYLETSTLIKLKFNLTLVNSYVKK